jgi:hypothetical protein
MSDQSKQEAAEHARQAAGQGKAAAKNAGRAVKTAAEPVMEAVAEEAHDTAEKLEGTAYDAARAVRKIDVGMLSRLSSDTGVGFLALSVSLWSGAVAYSKFRTVLTGRS